MFSTVISVCLYCLRLTIYLIFPPCVFNLTSESLFYPEIIPLEEGTGCPLVINSQFLSNTTFLSNFLNDVFTWECNFRLTYFLPAQYYSYLFLWETQLFLCRSSDSFSLRITSLSLVFCSFVWCVWMWISFYLSSLGLVSPESEVSRLLSILEKFQPLSSWNIAASAFFLVFLSETLIRCMLMSPSWDEIILRCLSFANIFICQICHLVY